MELTFNLVDKFVESLRASRNKEVFLVGVSLFPKKYDGCFRENIVKHLSTQFATQESYQLNQVSKTWCFYLTHDQRKFVIPLYVVEVCVDKNDERDPSAPHCESCVSAGWANHFLTRRSYHFIIPDRYWERPLNHESVFLKDQTHILHILIHCNGYGHLLCNRGTLNSNFYFPATEVRKLYTQICKNLGARKLSSINLRNQITVEEWPVEDDMEAENLLFIITPQLPNFMPAGVIIIHPYMGTFSELKLAAEIALRDTYCLTENFNITEIQGKRIEEYEDYEDDLPMLHFFSGQELSVKGDGVDFQTVLRYQGGCHLKMAIRMTAKAA